MKVRDVKALYGEILKENSMIVIEIGKHTSTIILPDGSKLSIMMDYGLSLEERARQRIYSADSVRLLASLLESGSKVTLIERRSNT